MTLSICISGKYICSSDVDASFALEPGVLQALGRHKIDSLPSKMLFCKSDSVCSHRFCRRSAAASAAVRAAVYGSS